MSKRQPRILWASAYSLLDTSSGAAIAVRSMLTQLIQRGYEVQIVTATIFDDPRGTSRFAEHRDEIFSRTGEHISIQDGPLSHNMLVTKSTYRLEMREVENIAWFQRYYQILETFKPDLVFYYGGFISDFLIAAEASARDIPAVAYLGNTNYQDSWWCRHTDLILCDSKATAALYKEREGYAIHPIGTFIEPMNVIATEHKRERILFVNPSWHKGVGLVIQLAFLMQQKRPDIKFEVVESNGSWQNAVDTLLPQFTSEAITLDNVIITQITADMRTVYEYARLVLAPSFCFESAGRVVIEGFMNGIPAIVTNRGGLPEMLVDGGIILELPATCYEEPWNALPILESLDGMVEALIRFYDDEDYYNEFCDRARRVAYTNHKIEESTQNLEDVLAPYLKKKAGNEDFKVLLKKIHKLELVD